MENVTHVMPIVVFNIRDKMFYFILYLYNKDLSMKLGHLRRGKFFYPFRKGHILPLPSAPSKNDT